MIKSTLKLFSGTYSVYYFPIMIIQFYVLLPIFQKYKAVRSLGICLCINFCYVALLYIFVLPYFDLPSIVIAGPIFFYISYFSVGSKYGLGEIKIKKKTVIFLIIVAFILSLADSYFPMKYNQSLNGIGSTLFRFLVVLILLSPQIVQHYKSNILFKCFEVLGRYSFGIYIIHLWVFGIINKVNRLISFSILDNTPFLSWILSIFITSILTFAALFVAKKIFPKVSSFLLGV